MSLTGKDVWKAFIASFPYAQPSWEELPEFSKEGYERMAKALTKIIKERIKAQNEEASSDDKEKR